MRPSGDFTSGVSVGSGRGAVASSVQSWTIDLFQNSSSQTPFASPTFSPKNVTGRRSVATSTQSRGLGRFATSASADAFDPRALVISPVSAQATATSAPVAAVACQARIGTRGILDSTAMTKNAAQATYIHVRIVGWSQCQARFVITAMPYPGASKYG